MHPIQKKENYLCLGMNDDPKRTPYRVQNKILLLLINKLSNVAEYKVTLKTLIYIHNSDDPKKFKN